MSCIVMSFCLVAMFVTMALLRILNGGLSSRQDRNVQRPERARGASKKPKRVWSITNVQSFVQSVVLNYNELECGPMPNLMVALPNIGGALCSTPQSLADAHY